MLEREMYITRASRMTDNCWNCGDVTPMVVHTHIHESVDYVIDNGKFWCRRCDVIWVRRYAW